MTEVMWRLLWISVISVLFAYVTFLFMGSVLTAQSTEQPLIIYSDVTPGRHHLKGVLLVPSDCHGVIVTVKEREQYTYHLIFQTWAEPNRVCNQVETSRAFETYVFAPATGVSFVASLDGEPLRFQILERYQ